MAMELINLRTGIQTQVFICLLNVPGTVLHLEIQQYVGGNVN